MKKYSNANNLIKKFIFILLIFLNTVSLFSMDFYWENPEVITDKDTRFPITISNNENSYVFWEEVDTKNNKIYLTGRRYDSLTNYTDIDKFAGPFSYSGNNVPDIYSAAILDDGTVAVAALSDNSHISVYTTYDKGKTFKIITLETAGMMVAPRIYKTHDNKFKLFTSVEKDSSFYICYSDSLAGLEWTDFKAFEPTESYNNAFIPVLEPVGNKDIVVFQAWYNIPDDKNKFSEQIYMTSFENDIWTAPVLLTNEKSLNYWDKNPFYKYKNQRPYLHNLNGTVYMSWERTSAVNSNIWVTELDENGIKDFTAEQISDKGNASRGILFSYDGNLYCNWFDTRNGKEAIYLAEKKEGYWDELSLTDNNKRAYSFSYPLILNHLGKDMLAFVWQESDTINSISSINMLCPDISVDSPKINPLTFVAGEKSNKENVEIQLIFPKDDPSGIAKYTYTWERYIENQNDRIGNNKSITEYSRNDKISVKAKEEGDYILSVKISDYAGNWSKPVSIVYSLDITPPESPIINIENIDNYGFMVSNNYNNLKWEASLSDDTDNYLYEIYKLGNIPDTLRVSSRHPLAVSAERTANKFKDNVSDKYGYKNGFLVKSGNTKNLSAVNYKNRPNGVYRIKVAAVDKVGNISDYSSELFVFNKFEPYTSITDVQLERKKMGDIILTIYGSGFTYDGTVLEIYMDSDGKVNSDGKYDFTIRKENNDFKVKSDSKIVDANFGPDVYGGKYKIGIKHGDRGIYFYENEREVPLHGTVKIEPDYTVPLDLSYEFEQVKYIITQNAIAFVLLIILILLVVVFILILIKTAIHESRINRLEIKSLMGGGRMPLLKKNDAKGKHFVSLKGKLIGFTFTVIILVVTGVTVRNGMNSIRLQSKTMASGLKDRATILLESLDSEIKNVFKYNENKAFRLASLPEQQKKVMSEVIHVTITGNKNDFSSKDLSYVWATNDERINSDIFVSGEYKLPNEIVPGQTSKFLELDEKISNSDEVKNKLNYIKANEKANAGTDLADKATLEKFEARDAELRSELDSILAGYSKESMGIYPDFDINNLDYENTNYIFYRPVIYPVEAENKSEVKNTDEESYNYINAVVYLELSTQTLIDSINAEKLRIIKLGLIIAIIAVIVGIIGSYLFASFIVRPVKRLESYVTMIGQTKNKINLKGKDIKIRSKDEVGRLGDAINIMTRELVLNAEEEELAMDGKAVQKAFLPLADTAMNVKNTIAEYEDENLQIYGYYEGESGVSGDYFDYKKLDKEWFCIIKCDASGHGIPAAIIMTVVATIFRRYFENWTFKKNGVKLNILVEQINDFIEGLGLKGKFATLIICLLNVRTGELYMCNAGDNLVHIFDGAKRKMKVITLKSVPTAGVFTSDLVAMRGGFEVEKTILNKGDTLFLYTDGIEESNRRIRNPDYSVRQNEIEIKKFNPKTRQEEVSVKLEDAKEEFGPERVAEIIESVYNRKKYVLTKEDNPNKSELLEFNFENCEGTVKDTILALASLEKVYRLYKTENVQTTDYIKIDKKIDEFLSKYFNMYEYYAANKTEATELSNYIDYDLMLEDEQSDDLTLLAIKRI